MLQSPRILLGGLVFPESPRWHDGCLWFSNQHAGQVLRMSAEGRLEQVAKMPGWAGGLGWDRDGRLLAVSMQDRKLLRHGHLGHWHRVADLGALAPWPCNDLVVDLAGRAYVDSFGFDLVSAVAPRPAALMLVEPNGSVRVVADDLHLPDGMAITPDGKTLIVAETLAARLTAFDIEPDGSLYGRRTWATLQGRAPGGICIDAEGAIWVACPMTGQVIRVLEGGEVSAEVSVMLNNVPFACVLGGPTGRTLYLCTAPESHPRRAVASPRGRIEMVEVDVPGVPQWRELARA